jgi:hypothetical protein
MDNEKLIRQRQERIARKREAAVERVADLEYQLHVLAGRLDGLVMRPPTMIAGGLFGFGGRRLPRRGRSL